MTAEDDDSVLLLHSLSPLKNKGHKIMPFCQGAQEGLGPGLRVLSGSVAFGTCRC